MVSLDSTLLVRRSSLGGVCWCDRSCALDMSDSALLAGLIHSNEINGKSACQWRTERLQFPAPKRIFVA